MSLILTILFVVLMLLWFLGGGYVAYQGDKFNPVIFGGGTLIPWLCVAILGYLIFSGTPIVVPR